ncbi:MAG: NfeD family protein [Gammaproteobacteria bacterium]
MLPIKFIGLFALLFLIALLQAAPLLAAIQTDGNPPSKPQTIVQLEIQDAIGPATSDYIERSFEKALESGAQAILITMDTPGGLDTSMRQIIKTIIASPIPVITYVTPGGARAASAGTYILYASHIAAMAPGTNLGAATPVQLIGSDPPGLDKKKEPETTDSENKIETAESPMARKAVNDAVAYIRSLANMRGRNADWAEKAVREAASLPSEEALKLNVIDLIATDLADLLKQLDNRTVNVQGHDMTLETRQALVKPLAPDWRSELLAVITNPNIAYILMLVGIYGLIFEFSNPGSVVPGTIGGICLLLALFAFQVLPVNYAGIALIILGIALMVAEAFVPSFGILGLGGVTAFVIGSVILMDTDAPGFGINIALVGAFALSSAAFFILAIGMLIKSRSRPIVTGREELLGKTGIVLEDFNESGVIRIHSELWKATTNQALHKNQKVIVTGLDGLTLSVTPFNNPEKD